MQYQFPSQIFPECMYYVPGNIVSSRDTTVNTLDKFPALIELILQSEQMGH